MTLNELLESTKQSLTERLASPLLGSFLVAWCFWNWKFLVILFSSDSVTQTFSMIDQIVFPDTLTLLTRGAFYPALTAAAYIFLYPYPARFVYGFTLRRQRETNQTKQQIADETLLTLEESRGLRAEYIEHDRKHTEVTQRLNDEIARLNAALDAVTRPPEPKSELSAAERMYDRLEPSQIFLLKALETIGSPALEDQLIKASTETKVKAEYDLGELERRKLLHRNFDQSKRAYTLEFTHEGRKALLRSKAEPEA